MLKIFQILCLFAIFGTAVGGAICNNERGPKLCHHQLLTRILLVCDSLENATELMADPTLPRCCCSFGCSDIYLRKALCPAVMEPLII